VSQEKDGCVASAAGPIAEEPEAASAGAPPVRQVPLARVGSKAPDFEASGYIAGAGFKNVKLSDYAGKWVVLCFYPGDFTFV